MPSRQPQAVVTLTNVITADNHFISVGYRRSGSWGGCCFSNEIRCPARIEALEYRRAEVELGSILIRTNGQKIGEIGAMHLAFDLRDLVLLHNEKVTIDTGR